MNATQIKRNQKVIRALKLNKKKGKGQMRRSNGNRCCLCVAEDTAIEDGLKLEKCSVSIHNCYPQNDTVDYLGWDGRNPDLVILKEKGQTYSLLASEVNDSEVNIPHRIIAEFMANTFTRTSFRLSKEARQFAKKLVDVEFNIQVS